MTTESDQQLAARASLWRKLAAVTAVVPPVKPTGYNNDIKKKYADSDDIITTLRPLLAEYQLAITVQINAVRHGETGQKTSNGAPFILTEIDCTFIIADGETGETLAVPWSAEAADHMKDKGLPKALTIARRTFLIHTFHIIAEEEKQLWGNEQQSQQQRNEQQSQQQRQAPPQRPAARPAPAQQPAPATNGNGSTKRPLTQQELVEALKTLWAEERRLGGETPAAEVATDLDEADREQLIDLGKKARARVLALQRQPRGMPEADLPASLPTTNAA